MRVRSSQERREYTDGLSEAVGRLGVDVVIVGDVRTGVIDESNLLTRVVVHRSAEREVVVRVQVVRDSQKREAVVAHLVGCNVHSQLALVEASVQVEGVQSGAPQLDRADLQTQRCADGDEKYSLASSPQRLKSVLIGDLLQIDVVAGVGFAESVEVELERERFRRKASVLVSASCVLVTRHTIDRDEDPVAVRAVVDRQIADQLDAVGQLLLQVHVQVLRDRHKVVLEVSLVWVRGFERVPIDDDHVHVGLLQLQSHT